MTITANTTTTRVTYRGGLLDRRQVGQQVRWAPARADHTWTIWRLRAADVLRAGGDAQATSWAGI